MSNSQPAPISGNVINQILYLEIPENNYRHVDKCCTAGLGTSKFWSLCCCTIKLSIVGRLCDREVVCSASYLQGLNFESCVWRTMPSHHPREVVLAQFGLHGHKCGLKPDSFHFFPRPIFDGFFRPTSLYF